MIFILLHKHIIIHRCMQSLGMIIVCNAFLPIGMEKIKLMVLAFL